MTQLIEIQARYLKRGDLLFNYHSRKVECIVNTFEENKIFFISLGILTEDKLESQLTVSCVWDSCVLILIDIDTIKIETYGKITIKRQNQRI